MCIYSSMKNSTPLTFYSALYLWELASFTTNLSLYISYFIYLTHNPNPSLYYFRCVLGVIGDSNVLCRTDPSANDFKRRSRTLLTTACSAGSDCLYGQCTNNICTTPDLLCPTSVIGIILILSYMKQMFNVLSSTIQSCLWPFYNSSHPFSCIFKVLCAQGMAPVSTLIPPAVCLNHALLLMCDVLPHAHVRTDLEGLTARLPPLLW